ncbi:polysaccharide biosynthesis C-terminal domain-containing protein [Danxiaibacter flavus]|uniref:Polysaccharide biosynthesis C-terminal domain-containing protein n=1 Tax=Danxiaibacter flavus TaxID=3049108 RepID=A0ABV3Z7X1_9BACT|nr:polysaccharide biosynthesis C-terminal domain-containing protein [Chitinophagaceae bacterium DXS]
MAEVRKKTILATLLIYIGFAIGALNTWLFTHRGFFDVDQYGLTRVFNEMTLFIFSVSTMGINIVIYKFFPFYNRNLPEKENDLLSGSLAWGTIGFLIVLFCGWLGHDLFIRKFATKSTMLVEYYYWLFPCAYFLLLYTLAESYAWQLHKAPFTNFLKEVLFRLITTVLIILYLKHVITFHEFMIGFALQYGIIFAALLYYLIIKQRVGLALRFSRVTKKFYRKMLTMIGYVFIGNVIHAVGPVIGGIVISSNNGLGAAGVYTFATYFGSILQAPQRSISALSVPILSNAWKDKDINGIRKVYQRSSINMLIAAIFLFFIIWLNYNNAINAFHINESYLDGKPVFLLIGLYWIIDMGTGVNAQIMTTSNHWRFEFSTSVLFVLLMIPTNYFLIKKMGITGAACAQLISILIYNIVRIIFLWKKYNLLPFTVNTLKLIAISLCAYGVTYLISSNITGFTGMFITTIVFSVMFLVPVFLLDITPDIKPVVATIKKRLSR